MALTTEDLQQIEAILNRKLDEKLAPIFVRLDRIGVRLDSLEARMGNLELRMDGVEDRMDNLEGRLEKLEFEVKDLRDGLNEQSLRLRQEIGGVNHRLDQLIAMQSEDVQQAYSDIAKLDRRLNRVEKQLKLQRERDRDVSRTQ